MKYKLAFVWLLLASSIAGCSYVSIPSLPSLPWSATAVQPNPTAEALFEDGMTYFNNKKYALAIDRFQRVKAEFPFSPQLIPAELKLAEAYYLNQQYPEAVAAFKEFQALHPTNENIPLVIYHLGLAHFGQFTATDRDQKITEIAKGYFETVVRNHPNSPYANQAKEKLAKCLEYLAEHEFHIAAFYLREKKYPAARDRLEEILRRYRETPTAVKTLYYLGESYRLEKNNLKAALAYEALIQHYPESALAKEARTQLAQVEKEKQDPLALLLMRDRRPTYASPPPESSEQLAATGEIQNEKELNLVAKKDVVHEEPGNEKGMLRRVADTINPLAWFSSSDDKNDKKEGAGKKAPAPSKKEDSPGLMASLWSGINPFSSKEERKQVEPAKDPQLVGKIDESLKKQGIDTGSQNPASRPPTSDLPKSEEPTPAPTTNTAALVGDIDAKLKKEGKNVTELPSPPEAAPVFKAASAQASKPATSKAEASPPPSASGLITGIDEALKRKGIEPAKVETTSKDTSREVVGVRREQPKEKIELAPRLVIEKGPLFLDSSQSEGRQKAQEGEQVQPPPTKSTEPRKELPQAIVKGPPQPQREKPLETKAAEKKKVGQEEEEEKSIFGQIKEDLKTLGTLLNPFGW
ncbi:MAG: outer membrane protein assembly factor BamD [Deltaproteobacteria bacterium]|nr:outer membrane protein assembly factor BamD [Deltaproteobacteria bacterium]